MAGVMEWVMNDLNELLIKLSTWFFVLVVIPIIFFVTGLMKDRHSFIVYGIVAAMIILTTIIIMITTVMLNGYY